MKKSFETEVFGALTQQQFEDFKAKFDQLALFAGRQDTRRLAIQITDFTRRDLDTRIRVTNGQAEIMQKIGDWDAKSREELQVAIPCTTGAVLNHLRILENMLQGEDVRKNIIQMESHVYLADGYEVKLTRQYGKSDHYSFEVEVFDDTEPLAICAQLGLAADTSSKDATYWDAYNKRVTIDARTLSEEQLEAIIGQHCPAANHRRLPADRP